MLSTAQTSEGSISPPVAQAQAQKSQELLKLYNDALYTEVAKLGSAQLALDPENHELRFAVANSAAWTGNTRAAIQHYKALQGTVYEDRAALGLANVYRWDGLHGLARPLYEKALVAKPDDKDAIEGLTYSMRELRPRTKVSPFWADDSSNTVRRGMTLSQRWSDASSRHRMELEAGTLEDERNTLRVRQRDLTFRYAGVGNPLRPRLEISGQQDPKSALFASGEIQVLDLPLIVTAGHVNWGKLAFDPNALKANLSANRIGVQGRTTSDIGVFSLSYLASRVSDQNTIQDAYFRYTPIWQPVKIQEVKFFVGAEGRKAKFNVPQYWSPADGNYLATVGVNAEWQDLVWEKSVLLQYGFPIGGEAENSYSVYARAKRWINNDWAIVFNVAHQKSQRTGAYRATSAAVSIEALW